MLAMDRGQADLFFLAVDSDEAEGVNVILAVFAKSMNLGSDWLQFP